MTAPAIGLEANADLLYRTMLGRRHWTTTELVGRLGWSADRLSAVLDDLSREGLVAESAEHLGALRAVEPCLALPAMVARRFRGTVRDGLPPADEVARFVAMNQPSAGRVGERSRFEGLDDVASFVERMAATVRGEVVQLVPTFVPGSFEFSRQVAEAVLRRGATLRIVWSSKVLAEPAAAEHAKWLAVRWSAPRVVDHVPMRVTLVDGATAVVHDDEGCAGVIQSTRALDSLSLIADRLWRNGVEVGNAHVDADAPATGARNEMVLRLLADGLTDDAIARRIGVSVRTVRNDVAGAMAGLQARSRFQAGVRAVQLGLV